MFFPAAAPPGAPHVLADLTAVSAAMATLVFRTYWVVRPGFSLTLPLHTRPGYPVPCGVMITGCYPRITR
jgi:hypothetical protein